MKVGCYCRVSTIEQAEKGYSIEEQISRMKSYCQAMDWSIFKIYSDPGISGATTDRPGLQMLCDDARSGLLDTVLVYKLDRLSRSQKDALYLIEDVFLGHGVNFVSISENFDTSTAFGRAMIGILAVFAQLERETIRERMTLGKTARAKAGKWHGSKYTPIGYDYDPEQGLIINEYEAMCVRKIFQWFLQGKSIREIELLTMQNGMRHRFGGYNRVTIRYILGNPVYTGKITDKGTIYDGVHQPIIDDETLAKSSKILAQNRDYWDKNIRGAKNISLLAGIIFCAKCGARYHRIKWRTAPVYICYSRSKKIRSMMTAPTCDNKYWHANVLDELIIDQVKSLSFDPGLLQPDANDAPDPGEQAATQKQLERLRKVRSRYMDLYAVDGIPIESLREKIDPLNLQIEALEQKIADMNLPKSHDAFWSVLHDARYLIDNATTEEKRAILLELIERIEINGDDVRIKWKI